MNTEYAVGNIRIHFESRARRRWFVALVYAMLAVFSVIWFPPQSHHYSVEQVGFLLSGLLIPAVALLIVFTWLTDGMRKRGDERETQRREHAYARAYRALGGFLVAALIAGYFKGSGPLTPVSTPAAPAFLMRLPYILLVATGVLYFTLPQAILLWTEPDMDAEG